MKLGRLLTTWALLGAATTSACSPIDGYHRVMASLTGAHRDPIAEMALANQPIACSDRDDCEVRWSRSVTWITLNSRMTKQTAEPPYEVDGWSKADFNAYFTADMQVAASGQGSVVFKFACVDGKACDPDRATVRTSFYHYVLALAG